MIFSCLRAPFRRKIWCECFATESGNPFLLSWAFRCLKVHTNSFCFSHNGATCHQRSDSRGLNEHLHHRFSNRKQESNHYQKLLEKGNLVMCDVAHGDKGHLWITADCKGQINISQWVRHSFCWFLFAICRFCEIVFPPQATLRAIPFFLFPVVTTSNPASLLNYFISFSQNVRRCADVRLVNDWVGGQYAIAFPYLKILYWYSVLEENGTLHNFPRSSNSCQTNHFACKLLIHTPLVTHLPTPITL